MNFIQLAFLTIFALSAVSASASAPIEAKVNIEVSSPYTIGGNLSENAVRDVIAESLRAHVTTSFYARYLRSVPGNPADSLYFCVGARPEYVQNLLDKLKELVDSNGPASRMVKFSGPSPQCTRPASDGELN